MKNQYKGKYTNCRTCKVESLEYALIGVMHSVDKWLEGDELNQHEVKRAIRMREKVLQIIEKQQVEIDKLKTETVEALEKQIPKEPNYQYDGYVDGEPVWDIWECPSCGAEFEIDYDRHKYCPECGQAIDWEVKK